METQHEKQTEIKIEVVSNGFIVRENYYDRSPQMRHPSDTIGVEKIKVFNTKKQLTNYINSNL